MRLAILHNSKLDEPYCFEGRTENGDWFGIGPYRPDQEIDSWLACDEQGRVWLWDPDRKIILDFPPLDEGQDFLSWVEAGAEVIA